MELGLYGVVEVLGISSTGGGGVTQTMSVHGVDVMQSWTDSRLAPVTHDVAAADLRLYGDDVDDVWTPQLHVINARRRLMADRHRVLAVSTGGLVILHQRYARPSRHCANPPRRGGVA